MREQFKCDQKEFVFFHWLFIFFPNLRSHDVPELSHSFYTTFKTNFQSVIFRKPTSGMLIKFSAYSHRQVGVVLMLHRPLLVRHGSCNFSVFFANSCAGGFTAPSMKVDFFFFFKKQSKDFSIFNRPLSFKKTTTLFHKETNKPTSSTTKDSDYANLL